MSGENGFERFGAESPGLEHGPGACAAFLSGLEDQDDLSRSPLRPPILYEQPGRAKGDCHVGVVAARVHYSRTPGSIRHVRFLLERKRVHIGPKTQRRPWSLGSDFGNCPGPSNTAPERDSEFAEDLGDLFGRFFFLAGEFGILVEMAPKLHQPVVKRQKQASTSQSVEHFIRG
jgi:hypothetical protein